MKVVLDIQTSRHLYKLLVCAGQASGQILQCCHHRHSCNQLHPQACPRCCKPMWPGSVSLVAPATCLNPMTASGQKDCTSEMSSEEVQVSLLSTSYHGALHLNCIAS